VKIVSFICFFVGYILKNIVNLFVSNVDTIVSRRYVQQLNSNSFLKFVENPGQAIVFSFTSMDQMLLGLIILAIIDYFGSLTSS
jgi:hypothetical protein